MFKSALIMSVLSPIATDTPPGPNFDVQKTAHVFRHAASFRITVCNTLEFVRKKWNPVFPERQTQTRRDRLCLALSTQSG